MRYIDKIILHCSATPEGKDFDVEDIRSWHVNGNGWRDIGYHFVIKLDGTIEFGRPITEVGAHCYGYNSNSIGICYIGGCDKDMNPKDTRDYTQKRAMDILIGELLEEFPNATVHGHNEFASKACPSFDVQDEYGYFNK